MPFTKLPDVKGVTLELRPSGILQVTMNTPKTYNSFDDQRYADIIAALKYTKENDHVKAMSLCSTGKFFSSGAALSGDRMETSKSGSTDDRPAKKYIDVLIDFPKLLIAVVQGPAYGIAVTTLPYFDLVFAAPEATFTTPFSTLGICLEGCSSVTFPALLGHALSTRLLYMAETVSCEDMVRAGLIAEVMPADGIQKAVLDRVEKQLETLSVQSIMASKGLVMTAERRKYLHKVNQEEMAVLAQRVQSDDHRQALSAFQARRKAKKASKL